MPFVPRIRQRPARVNARWPGSGDPSLIDIGQQTYFPVGGQLHADGNASQQLPISGTAYFAYIATLRAPLTPAHVWVKLDTNGVGAQTAEIGLFSTPNAPNKAGQVLTRLVSSNTVDDLTTGAGSNGTKGNPTAFATEIATGTHLWAGIRIAMATTQPRLAFAAGDRMLGYGLTTTSAASLAGSATTWSGATMPPALFTGSTNSLPAFWVTTF